MLLLDPCQPTISSFPLNSGSPETATVISGLQKITTIYLFKEARAPFTNAFLTALLVRPGSGCGHGPFTVRALSLVCRQPPLHCVLIRPFLSVHNRGKRGLIEAGTFPNPACYPTSPQGGSIGDCWCFLPAAETTVRKQRNI